MKHFVAGLGIGFGIGMLLAPRRGEETREQLKNQASDLAEAVSDRVKKTVGNPAELYNNAQERLAAIGQQISSRTKEVVSVMLNKVSREDLLSVYGIGPVMADKILANRPYSNDRQVVEQGIVPESLFERLERELLRRGA